MGVIADHAENGHAVGEQGVPELLAAHAAAGREIIGFALQVEYFEMMHAAQGPYVLGVDRPFAVGVVDHRQGPGLARGVDGVLQRFAQALPGLGHGQALGIQGADMGLAFLESEADLIAGNNDEIVAIAVGVKRQGGGYHVVVGDEQEMVAVVLVPARHALRIFIAVRLVGMGVGVALDPAALWHAPCPGSRCQHDNHDQYFFHLLLRGRGVEYRLF